MSGFHPALPLNRNITGTLPELAVPVTAETPSGDAARGRRRRPPRRCGYVVAPEWRYGAPDPFCGAPAMAGSSYCAAHRALCVVDPATAAGRRLSVRQAAAGHAILPAEFPPLAAPEPLPDPDPVEALAGLDLPPPNTRPLADDPA